MWVTGPALPAAVSLKRCETAEQHKTWTWKYILVLLLGMQVLKLVIHCMHQEHHKHTNGIA